MNEILEIETKKVSPINPETDIISLPRSDYEKLVSERDEYREIALAFSERYQAMKKVNSIEVEE